MATCWLPLESCMIAAGKRLDPGQRLPSKARTAVKPVRSHAAALLRGLADTAPKMAQSFRDHSTWDNALSALSSLGSTGPGPSYQFSEQGTTLLLRGKTDHHDRQASSADIVQNSLPWEPHSAAVQRGLSQNTSSRVLLSKDTTPP